MELGYAAVLVGGVAIVVYGILGRGPFYNAADLPMSEEERDDKRPATRLERAGYIGFGLVIFVYGFKHLFR
jgi:hypothetical protein